MTQDEVPATFAPDEPDPPYVDNSPPAAPDELEQPEPEFQPTSDVVEDPEAETPSGVEP